jgi:hypothetical protein
MRFNVYGILASKTNSVGNELDRSTDFGRECGHVVSLVRVWDDERSEFFCQHWFQVGVM